MAILIWTGREKHRKTDMTSFDSSVVGRSASTSIRFALIRSPRCLSIPTNKSLNTWQRVPLVKSFGNVPGCRKFSAHRPRGLWLSNHLLTSGPWDGKHLSITPLSLRSSGETWNMMNHDETWSPLKSKSQAGKSRGIISSADLNKSLLLDAY